MKVKNEMKLLLPEPLAPIRTFNGPSPIRPSIDRIDFQPEIWMP